MWYPPVQDAHQHVLNIPSFEEASFLEAGGSPFPTFGSDYADVLPENLDAHQVQV